MSRQLTIDFSEASAKKKFINLVSKSILYYLMCKIGTGKPVESRHVNINIAVCV
jgi:hypothetical protein